MSKKKKTRKKNTLTEEKTMKRYDFSKEYIEKRRTFPKNNAVILAICIVIQIILVTFSLTYESQPLDVIKNYTVTVTPLENGTLDIEYDILWKALSDSEELTWVDIGVANDNYTVYENSLSENIDYAEHYYDEGYTSYRIFFKEPYISGDVFKIKFKINQQYMLCQSNSEYFYEFIPGWFNEIPIENYTFKWKASEQVTNEESLSKQGRYYIWSGSLECGEYEKLFVSYSEDTFNSNDAISYLPFDDSGAYNALKDDKSDFRLLAIIAIIGIFVYEIYIIDSFISYSRGRGFLYAHGHKVHLFGRTNPKYIRARNAYQATHNSGRSGGGGGCACACACACAGGGRAGCSQKDGYTNIKTSVYNNE